MRFHKKIDATLNRHMRFVDFVYVIFAAYLRSFLALRKTRISVKLWKYTDSRQSCRRKGP